MGEGPPIFEDRAEHFPTEKEVWSVFEKLIGGREYSEVEKKVDEQGLYVWDIKIVGEDGDKVEYLYKRAGKSSTGIVAEPTIQNALYDSEGVPVGGGSLYKFRNGEWVETP